jgi:proline iminopeptidase
MKRIIAGVAILLVTSFAHGQPNIFEGKKKINGTSLYLKVKGRGEYLLVVHGGPGLNHAYFIPYLDQLEKKFTVIYYDQRACGQSSIPAPDSISIKLLVDDIETIRKDFNIEKLNILAHSWGAVLVTHYALAYPDKVKKVIMSNPAMFSHEYDEEVGTLMRERSTREDSVARASILADGNLDAHDYEKIFLLTFKLSAYNKENVRKINLNLPDNFSAANNALFTGLSKDPAMNVNLYDSLPNLKFPVLVLHGQADLIPMRAIQRLKEKLAKGKLEIFKQSGHFPFVEETAAYNVQVSDFLR